MKDLTTQSYAPHITNDSFPVRQGYKWTEVGVIPEDWKIQKLDAICSVYSGGTPSTARHDFYGGHIPWITSGDLNARRITKVSNYLTQAGFDSSAAKMVESGDLVIALYGATAGVVAVTEIEAAINQAVLAIKTNRCDSEYLFHHLENRKNQIVATYTQGGQPNLSGEIIRSLDIVIPPLAEQCAIAEALSDVDGLLNALEALIAKKRAIKQAAMQQLLTGKTRLPGFSGAWTEKPLSDLAVITMGQSPSSIFYNSRGAGLPLIQGKADIENCHTIERVWTTQGNKRCNSGDLILTVRAPVGAVAIASKNAFIGRGVCSLKPVGDSRFLFYTLVYAENRWQTFEQGSTFTAANSEHVGQFRLYVPNDIDEQRAIATVLSDMDAEITAMEQRRDKTIAIKQGMMQQLLTGRVRLSESRISMDDAESENAAP